MYYRVYVNIFSNTWSSSSKYRDYVYRKVADWFGFLEFFHHKYDRDLGRDLFYEANQVRRGESYEEVYCYLYLYEEFQNFVFEHKKVRFDEKGDILSSLKKNRSNIRSSITTKLVSTRSRPGDMSIAA